jgi:hypothetical protein
MSRQKQPRGFVSGKNERAGANHDTIVIIDTGGQRLRRPVLL